jgi:hypothetical protein
MKALAAVEAESAKVSILKNPWVTMRMRMHEA